MIRKSVKRFSEKIMPKQEAKARRRFILISPRFSGRLADAQIRARRSRPGMAHFREACGRGGEGKNSARCSPPAPWSTEKLGPDATAPLSRIFLQNQTIIFIADGFK